MHVRTFLAIVLTASACAVASIGCGGDDQSAELAALDAETAPNVTYETGDELEITAENLNLLAAPGPGNEVLGVLPKGTVVLAFETSGEGGWVHVMAPDITADGQPAVGFVSGKYVKPTSNGNANGVAAAAAAATGGSCDPSGGANAVGKYEKALHDMLAYAEGTRGYSQDGYNVMYSFKVFSSCTSHPNQCLKFGRTCSTAAGRYQFLTTTWNGAKSARSLSTFEPVNQEKAAEYLVGTVRKVTVPQGRALTATEFTNMLSKLSYEWASLPPGRYGQPKRAASVLRVDYCRLAGCDGTTAVAPPTGSSTSSSSGGSSGGPTGPSEDCDSKADGYYCSVSTGAAAFQCRGGSRVGVTYCDDTSKTCVGGAGQKATLSAGKLSCQ